MRQKLIFSLVALGAAAFNGQVLADHSWFDSERDAVAALSDGPALDVFDCTQCDADNASHRTTLAFVAHLLSELRASEHPAQGAFLLRERVQPRYYVDSKASESGVDGAESDRDSNDGDAASDAGVETLALKARTGCDEQGWSPSLTRWEYDLDRDEARPADSACLAFTEAPTPIRMSCKGCDLERLGEAVDIREQLEAAYWALFRDDDSVTTGEIIVTDSVNSGFRRLDFRAYRGTVYLGPSDGDYYVISLGTGKELAQQP